MAMNDDQIKFVSKSLKQMFDDAQYDAEKRSLVLQCIQERFDSLTKLTEIKEYTKSIIAVMR